jgi:hypothetical protein
LTSIENMEIAMNINRRWFLSGALLWTLLSVSAACSSSAETQASGDGGSGGSGAGATTSAAGGEGSTTTSSTTGSGGAGGASCDSPGTVTTETPVCTGEGTTCSVTPLACTRTATALACELGTPHGYTETVSGEYRLITANGLPSHDVGAFPNGGNPNTISPQAYDFRVPMTPSGAGSTKGAYFGVLRTGVVLDPGTAETWNDDTGWRYEALRYGTATEYFSQNGGTDETFHPDALGLDCNLAHVQPTGAYHYHGVPTSLVPSSPAVTFVGWAADGYPIVALYDHADANDPASEVREMASSWQLKSGARPSGDEGPGGTYDGTFGADWQYVAGSGDLDDCNGREGPVTIDGATVTTYHYVLTRTFPYIPRCWKAAPDPSFAQQGGPPGTGGGGPGGDPAPCAPGQMQMCCGDGQCDGPETADNCPEDCP